MVKYRLVVSLLTACLVAAPAMAQRGSEDKGGTKGEDLFSLDLEALLNMKVITASKFSENLSEAPGMISVVSKDELRRFGGITLREILERVPGLASSTASFTDRSIVAARGDQTKINGGHILFLINGRPTREILEGGLAGDLLESFPVGTLERIEVIKGPGSVLYGSNAFSGVVNLITRKAERNEVVVSGLGTRGPGAATSAQFTLKQGDLGVVGAGQFHEKPSWATPVWSPVAGLEQRTIQDRGKGGYVGIDFRNLTVMSSFTEWKTSYIEGTVGEARWRRGFADVGYRIKPRERWAMDVNLTYTRTTLDAAKTIPFIDRDSNEVVAEWTNVVRLGGDQVTFGALYSHVEGLENFYGQMPGVVIAKGSRPGEALYAQADHELFEHVKLIGGLQANKIGTLAFNVVPRAGVVWDPANRWAVKTLYSEAFRAPSINETLIAYGPPPTVPGPSLTGDPNLSPEKVSTIDVGVSYHGNRFQGGAGFFHSRQTDSIILDASTEKWKYVNLGETTFNGLELDGKYYFRRHFFLTGSMLYQVNHDGNGHHDITPIANFGAKAGVSYDWADRFTASLFDVYQGSLDGYAAARNPKPQAYHMVNTHLRYDLSSHMPAHSKTGLALVAHANNLMNRPVWLPDWKDNPGDTIFTDRGRSIYVGIDVTFGK